MDRKSARLNNDKEDRISTLPDSILSHILSFLHTKEAVATSILSKRWMFVWMSIPNLYFDDRLCLEYEHRSTYNLSNGALTMFENFVNRVLVLSYPVNINKFSLHCSELRYYSCLNFWVSTAIMRNVREIEITIKPTRTLASVEMPECICTSKTLEVLKLNLDFVIKIPPSGIFFPSLKILHVQMYNLEDDLAEILFSNFPVLEDLSIMGHLYGAFVTFNISSTTLKRLTLAFDHNDELILTKHHIVIMAPNLEHLSIMDWPPVSYVLHESNSLTEVFLNLNFHCYPPVQCVVNILKGIKTAKFLSLSKSTIMVLELAGMDFFPTFPNLTCLEVEAVNSGSQLLAIILISVPNLESLVFGRDIGPEYGWTEPQVVPDCLLSHMKTIEIREFEGHRNQLKLIKYLLKTGEVLNTLTISIRKTWSENTGSREKLCEELLTFERGSKTCIVKVV